MSDQSWKAIASRWEINPALRPMDILAVAEQEPDSIRKDILTLYAHLLKMYETSEWDWAMRRRGSR